MNPRAAGGVVLAVVVVTAGFSVLLPGERGVLVAAGALFLLAAASVAAVASAWRARPARPSPFDSLESPAPRPARPDDLVRLERVLGWKAYSRAEFGATVAPVLGRILTARVEERFGVDAVSDPERARSLVQPELWGLLDRSYLPASGSSVTTRDIAYLVDLIEAV